MDSISIALNSSTSTTTVNSITARFCLPSSLHPRRSRNVSFEKNPRKVSVLASKDEDPKLDPLDQMELKFGRMLGEDPKLTLAKVSFCPFLQTHLYCILPFRYNRVYKMGLCHICWRAIAYSTLWTCGCVVCID